MRSRRAATRRASPLRIPAFRWHRKSSLPCVLLVRTRAHRCLRVRAFAYVFSLWRLGPAQKQPVISRTTIRGGRRPALPARNVQVEARLSTDSSATSPRTGEGGPSSITRPSCNGSAASARPPGSASRRSSTLEATPRESPSRTPTCMTSTSSATPFTATGTTPFALELPGSLHQIVPDRDLTFNVLYVLVLSLERRRVQHVNVT